MNTYSENKWNQVHSAVGDFDPEFHPTLLEYGKECKHITEFGVRWVDSTFSFILAKPNKLISIDIDHPSIHTSFNGQTNLEEAYKCAEECEVDFSFKQADVLEIDIEETDLLFIDTEHSYLQLKHELIKHSSKVRKYILLHDTLAHKDIDSNSYGRNIKLKEIDKGDFEKRGLGLAISEFLEKNKNWKLKQENVSGQGMVVLERIN